MKNYKSYQGYASEKKSKEILKIEERLEEAKLKVERSKTSLLQKFSPNYIAQYYGQQDEVEPRE